MKKQIFATAAAALVIAITGPPAHASLTPMATDSGDLALGATSTTDVNYDEGLDSSSKLYNYVYSGFTIAGDNSGQFTINANGVTSSLASGTSFSGAANDLADRITDLGNSLENRSWVWSPDTEDEQLLRYTSLYMQSTPCELLGDGSNGPWVDHPSFGGTLTAVPETSTNLAGVSLLLPLGIGMVRTLRKIGKG